MTKSPRGAAIKLLVNDLVLVKRRADQLRLGVISRLIALALLSLSAVVSLPGDDTLQQNDNDPASSQDADR